MLSSDMFPSKPLYVIVDETTPTKTSCEPEYYDAKSLEILDWKLENTQIQCKFLLGKHVITYEWNQRQISFPIQTVINLQLSPSGNQLTIQLGKQPIFKEKFFCEKKKKHSWKAIVDFMEGKASSYPLHIIIFNEDIHDSNLFTCSSRIVELLQENLPLDKLFHPKRMGGSFAKGTYKPSAIENPEKTLGTCFIVIFLYNFNFVFVLQNCSTKSSKTRIVYIGENATYTTNW